MPRVGVPFRVPPYILATTEHGDCSVPCRRASTRTLTRCAPKSKHWSGESTALRSRAASPLPAGTRPVRSARTRHLKYSAPKTERPARDLEAMLETHGTPVTPVAPRLWRDRVPSHGPTSRTPRVGLLRHILGCAACRSAPGDRDYWDGASCAGAAAMGAMGSGQHSEVARLSPYVLFGVTGSPRIGQPRVGSRWIMSLQPRGRQPIRRRRTRFLRDRLSQGGVR
jgi:hypothetical protein